jgi:hypothetical protein
MKPKLTLTPPPYGSCRICKQPFEPTDVRAASHLKCFAEEAGMSMAEVMRIELDRVLHLSNTQD